jgi:hypothetical protein
MIRGVFIEGGEATSGVIGNSDRILGEGQYPFPVGVESGLRAKVVEGWPTIAIQEFETHHFNE